MEGLRKPHFSKEKRGFCLEIGTGSGSIDSYVTFLERMVRTVK